MNVFYRFKKVKFDNAESYLYLKWESPCEDRKSMIKNGHVDFI